MIDTDRAYYAALFDGEGSFSVRRAGCWQVVVELSISDEATIDDLVLQFGGSKRVRRLPGRKAVYRWEISDKRRIAAFIECVGPYFRIKRRHSEVVGKYLATSSRRGIRLAPDAKRRRLSAVAALKVLNLRGV